MSVIWSPVNRRKIQLFKILLDVNLLWRKYRYVDVINRVRKNSYYYNFFISKLQKNMFQKFCFKQLHRHITRIWNIPIWIINGTYICLNKYNYACRSCVENTNDNSHNDLCVLYRVNNIESTDGKTIIIWKYLLSEITL